MAPRALIDGSMRERMHLDQLIFDIYFSFDGVNIFSLYLNTAAFSLSCTTENLEISRVINTVLYHTILYLSM